MGQVVTGLLERLLATLGNGGVTFATERHGFKLEEADIDKIIVLRQMRKTFDQIKISNLSANIAENGLIHLPTCVFFTALEAAEHLRIINVLWKRKYRLSEFADKKVTVDDEEGYLFLVAGERRLRSTKHLRKKDPASFAVWFPEGVIPISVRKHEHPFQCIAKQFAENTPEAVPPYEEAWAYAALYETLQNAGVRCSYTALGKMVNRGRSVIVRALEFANQPAYIQQAVADGYLKYSVAHSLSLIEQRLQKKMTYYRTVNGVRLTISIDTSAELRRWFEMAMENSMRARQLEERFSKQVEEWTTGQGSLWDTDEASVDEGGREFDAISISAILRRDSAAAELVKQLKVASTYVQRLRTLHRQGKMAAQRSPLSTASAQRAVKDLVTMMESLNDEARWLIEKSRVGARYRKALEESNRLFLKLEEAS